MPRGRARERWIALACAAACVAGLGRDVSVHLWKEGWPRTHRVDERYQPLLAALPARGRIGFVTELRGEQAGHALFDARYALSPRLVSEGAAAITLAEGSPEFVAALCRDQALRETARAGMLSLLEAR